MRKYRFFGRDIAPDCEYCQRQSAADGNSAECKFKRKMKNGKCRRFDYNPTMRKPLAPAELPVFGKDDFKI